LAVTDASGAGGSPWETVFSPGMTGRWEVRATDAANHTVRAVFPVREKAVSAESLNLAADLAGMKQLAEDTGGTLVDDATDFQSPSESAAPPAAKLPVPLWNCGPLLLLLLGAYATELILRRRCKLL
jgi:hypothetical protein